MKYTVRRIDEDIDFGCEERLPGAPVMVVVTLEGENSTITTRQPDALLYERDINEGDQVTFDERNELKKQVKNQCFKNT